MDKEFVEAEYAGIEPREGPIEDAELEVCAADPGTGVSGASAPNASGPAGRGSRVGRTASPDFFEGHGISTKVAEARPYLRYEQGEAHLLREHWQNNRQAARIANQSGGLVIVRHAPVTLGLSKPPAELRPDSAVVTDSHWHYHGEPQDELIIPSTGNRLPQKWTHAPDNMARHIEKKHGGVNDQTVHLDENRAKYVFPTGNGAKRIDMHPDAWSRFTNASRVLFMMEGCIKADCALSQGEAVLGVPSVTLWRAPDLDATARYLRGRVTYLVIDADGFTNHAVMTQAMFLHTYLTKRGVCAYVAAPPYDAFQRNPELKGYDDHCVSGGTTEDLIVIERETGPADFALWLAARGKWKNNKVVLAAEVRDALAKHAGEDGKIEAPLRSVARIMGVHHSRVARGVHALEECEGVTISGSLETKARWYGKGIEWEDRPVITLHPDLRAKTTFRRLGG
jgi:hypothetical protein